MSRQEANEQYAKALKAGQKHYRDCVIRGRYPYPQVLDEILDDSMAAGRVDMGLISIPTEGIVGTKAAGRTSAFAATLSLIHILISVCLICIVCFPPPELVEGEAGLVKPPPFLEKICPIPGAGPALPPGA